MTTGEMQSRYRHIGIGVIVGIVMYVAFFWGVFGPVDKVTSLGVGFSSGFSASIIAWMASD